MPVKNPIGLGPGLLPGAGFLGGYLSKILAVEPASLIGVWLQNEASGSVSFDHSGKGNNGLYTGVTLGQPGVPGMGMTSPFFDGANDFNNIYSAGLNADFDGAEGAVLAWAKVSGAGVWEDSTNRKIVHLGVDATTNRITIFRPTGNNTITFTYEAGNVVETQNATLSSLGFVCYAMTWSKSGDAVKYYLGGATVGATDTSLGVWAGNLGNTVNTIGVGNTTPGAVWSGNIGPAVLYNKALTAAQIAYLSTP